MKRENYELAKRICEPIIEKVKNDSKYESLPLLLKINEYINEDSHLYIQIFEDESYLDTSSDKYMPEAELCFESIYYTIENAIGVVEPQMIVFVNDDITIAIASKNDI